MWLDTDRQDGPIPFSAIDRYARRYGLDEIDDFDAFAGIVSAMDAEARVIKADQNKHYAALQEQLEHTAGPPSKTVKAKILGD